MVSDVTVQHRGTLCQADGSGGNITTNTGWLRTVLVVVSAIGLFGAVAYALARRPSPVILNVQPPNPTPFPSITATPAPIRCHVLGAVKEPGVYALPVGAVVWDAVQVAGGLDADADVEDLNMAEAVHDEAQVIVPHKVAPDAQDAPATRSAPRRTAGAGR